MEVEYKQFVILPKKPRMSKGKLVSQGCHAAFIALENQRELINHPSNEKVVISKWNVIHQWKREGMYIIVLECPTQIELMNFAKYLEQWKVPHHLYIDEGMTEIPAGTATALATGVLPLEHHWMLSQFKLFRG